MMEKVWALSKTFQWRNLKEKELVGVHSNPKCVSVGGVSEKRTDRASVRSNMPRSTNFEKS